MTTGEAEVLVEMSGIAPEARDRKSRELGGGKPLLGIPTVLDRLIKQALHQELMRLFGPEIFLRQPGVGFVTRPPQSLSVYYVNRRVRNRTYGGVG